MITEKENPVEWALLMYELDDVREHIETLLKEMNDDEFCEEDYSVSIAHIYAHLNRAWNSRNIARPEADSQEFDQLSQFPTDITPLG